MTAPNRLQSGYTATAMAIFLTVVGVGTLGAARQTVNAAVEAQARAAGRTLSDINGAMGVYLANQYNLLLSGAPVAGVANAYSPTIPELQAMGLLNANINAVPPVGGGYVTVVKKQPVGCFGSACNLSSQVYFTQPFIDPGTGGPDIRKLGSATQEIGGDSGFSDNVSPSTINGIGGWSLANPNGSVPGTLLAINGYGSSAFGAFFRKDGSVAMTGNADFGGNSLNNADALNAKSAALQNGLSAQSASISGGVAAGSLMVPGGNNVVVGSTALYGDSTNSAIRQNGSFYVQHMDGSAADIAQVGSVTSTANIVSYGSMRPGAVYNASVGAGCSDGNGAVSSDVTGTLLVCKGGVWSSAAAGVSRKVLWSGSDYGTGWLYAPNVHLVSVTLYNCPGNYYSVPWQQMIDVDDAIAQGSIVIRNRGGQNADREYGSTVFVSRSGDYLNFSTGGVEFCGPGVLQQVSSFS
jgi:hypothetical protein